MPGVTMTSKETDRYAALERVLDEALAQAACGKGAERHGDDSTRFEDQPGMVDARELGPAGPIYQARKKLLEGARMSARGQHDAAEREWLGAIVYSAMAVIAARSRL